MQDHHSVFLSPLRPPDTLLLWLAGVGLCLVLTMLAMKMHHMITLTQFTPPMAGKIPSPSNSIPLDQMEQLFASPSQAHISETHIGLVLTGALATSAQASEQAGASAIIAVKDTPNSARLYRIGDTIAPGVTLENVYANGVILNRRGVRESLSFHLNTGGTWLTPQTHTSLSSHRKTITPLYRFTQTGIASHTLSAPSQP